MRRKRYAMNTPSVVVVTDLDGTLLDHDTYSWQPAKPALSRLKEKNIPVIINTSKTYSETLDIVKETAVSPIFICENGSSLFVHESCEELIYQLSQHHTQKPLGNYSQFIFGKPRSSILNTLQSVRKEKSWAFEGFNDWSVTKIIEETGLPYGNAQHAANRHASEPIQWFDTEENLLLFEEHLTQFDLHILKGGRFFHIQGKTNKAKPLQALKSAYIANNNNQKSIKIVALGDSHNDIALLNSADIAICIKTSKGKKLDIKNKNVIYTTEKGPTGWNSAINTLIDNHSI